MLARHPDVPVCIDHVSQIDLTVDDPEPEFRRLLALAKHPSVHVKISELTSVSGAEYPFASALPWVKRVHEAFGPDRLLWGTGYPGAARAAYGRPTLTDELKLVREHLPFLDEQDRHKILGENAARIWTL